MVLAIPTSFEAFLFLIVILVFGAVLSVYASQVFSKGNLRILGF
ncbi:hypothetical protein [Borrelia nietonii]|nr:hypothetical protein [Borrelia nietonii]AHH14084.1 hypothetical protein BHW_0900084 [Borrelia hermsii MTW]